MAFTMLDTADASSTNAMVAVAGAFIALTVTAVSLRVYVRGFMIKSFGWDDWLMLVTLVFYLLGVSILIVIAYDERHYAMSDLKKVSLLLEYVVVEGALYLCTAIFLKISLGLFFLRVVVERWQRWVIIVSLSIYTAFTIGFLFLSVFSCPDPSKFLVLEYEGKCLTWDIRGPLCYVHGSFNALMDILFATLPILFIRKSKMPRRAKISVCLILCVGALGCVASVVRLAYIDGLNGRSAGFFLQAVNISIASTIEPGLGIVAASLATLRPLLRLIMNKSRHGSPNKNTSSEGRNSQSQAATVVATKMVSKSLGEFALYGYSDDLEKYGATTESALSPSSSIAVPIDTDESESVPPPLGHREPSFTPSHWVAPADSRKPSTIRSQIGGSRRETWSDLSEAQLSWNERIRNSVGDVRIEPNLLLPDADFDATQKHA